MNVHGKGSDAGALFVLTVAYDLIRDAEYAPGNRMPVIGDTRYDTEANLLSALFSQMRPAGELEHLRNWKNHRSDKFLWRTAPRMAMIHLQASTPP